MPARPMKVAAIGGHGKTGRAVCAGLAAVDVGTLPLGRADWPYLAAAVAGCEAAYVIAPNLHPDEPAYVSHALASLHTAGVRRVVYHSVASPYAPAMPHHLGKARSEDLVRRSGLAMSRPAALGNVVGFSAPVFDSSGLMVLALSAVKQDSGDAGADERIAQGLLAAARRLSARLGYPQSTETTQ